MNKVVAIVVILVVAAAIVVALVVGDTPQEARERKADDVRVRDLQQLYYSVNSYYQNEESLPTSLVDLGDPVVESFKDPLTEEPYTYRVVSNNQFELCATFDTATDAAREDIYYPTKPDSSYNIRFHDAGLNCFTLSVSSSD